MSLALEVAPGPPPAETDAETDGGPARGPVEVFGIRHHGPGSARSLVAALDAYEPDCVLVEGPADADPLLRFVGDDGAGAAGRAARVRAG